MHLTTTDHEDVCSDFRHQSMRKSSGAQTEANVLREYAKLNQRLKVASILISSSVFSPKSILYKMVTETKRLGPAPEGHLLKDMRNVETKTGLVLTLVRPSFPHLASC